MYSYTAPAAPSRLQVTWSVGHTWELHDNEWETNVLHSVHRVLAGNTSFPLTTNPSGKGKKRILPPGETEIKITPLSNHI